ncbi:hypothetical protein Scep_003090 [Stephania cephalantha]|uniref:Uncharacterized protein n=1 Tax=Stephania cephalantha TaxID=152367 RepID=A0AAP0KPV4_9MAGN
MQCDQLPKDMHRDTHCTVDEQLRRRRNRTHISHCATRATHPPDLPRCTSHSTTPKN